MLSANWIVALQRERVAMLVHQDIGRLLGLLAHGIEPTFSGLADKIRHRLVKSSMAIIDHSASLSRRFIAPEIRRMRSRLLSSGTSPATWRNRPPICIVSTALRIDKRWLRSSSATRSARSGKSSDRPCASTALRSFESRYSVNLSGVPKHPLRTTCVSACGNVSPNSISSSRLSRYRLVTHNTTRRRASSFSVPASVPPYCATLV